MVEQERSDTHGDHRDKSNPQCTLLGHAREPNTPAGYPCTEDDGVSQQNPADAIRVIGQGTVQQLMSLRTARQKKNECRSKPQTDDRVDAQPYGSEAPERRLAERPIKTRDSFLRSVAPATCGAEEQ